MNPKHAKRVTIDGANTSLNFKEVEELGEDVIQPSMVASTSKRTYKRMLGASIPE